MLRISRIPSLPTQVPFTHQMTAVSRLVEVLRQDLVLGVQAVGVVPPHPAPLQAQPVGVVAGQQGRPGGRTLRVEVRLVQQDLLLQYIRLEIGL